MCWRVCAQTETCDQSWPLSMSTLFSQCDNMEIKSSLQILYDVLLLVSGV